MGQEQIAGQGSQEGDGCVGLELCLVNLFHNGVNCIT